MHGTELGLFCIYIKGVGHTSKVLEGKFRWPASGGILQIEIFSSVFD
jgi:hypothetical protein